MAPACAPGMGIFIALTGTVGDALFWVISVLVCEGRCEGGLIGGAVPGRWCNARGSCIVVFINLANVQPSIIVRQKMVNIAVVYR
jgi:hypothetical protein